MSASVRSENSSAFESVFDVLVVGAGHAGTEAAVAAARSGASVALLTTALEQIGQLSCNPAIGGVAKGTVAREVDALGGIMGRATDQATVQFRMLNRGKGPAVWAPRAQCDRGLYRRAVRGLLEEQPNLTTLQGTAARLLLDEAGQQVMGVETLEGRRFGTRAIVLTTGTFGRGRLHIGTTTAYGGGRAGEASATHLGEQLDALGLTTKRFKTGTPPRIDGRSVDFAVLDPQLSEIEQFDYSWSHFWTSPRRNAARAIAASIDVSGAHATRDAHDAHFNTASKMQGHAGETRHPLQLPCWITFLEANGKAIIEEHILESAMYGGAISAQGPRYCPSVEDKVVRFPDAERHQLFLEPEGHDTHELYVNGLSTSLPSPVQLEILRSVKGLSNVRMTRSGYAIEYDYYPPTQLDASLASRALRGLYFAGQVNGTTGYEEAAGQGVIAGINAARWVQEKDPLVLGRETSYIGVLVDDLVSRGVDEPYRLFTSRSEFRLTVRQENALERLGPTAESLGLLNERERETMHWRLDAVTRARALADATSITPVMAADILKAANTVPLVHAVRATELARRNNVSLKSLFEAACVGADLPAEAVVSAELEIKYSGYFARERLAADKLKAMGDFALGDTLPYSDMITLSTEARQKLTRRLPSTLAQASSIPGISPADLQNLVFEVERRNRAVALSKEGAS